MTHARDVELARSGDRRGLVDAHRGLGAHIARKFAYGESDPLLDDMIQQAMLGLLAAAERWDPEFGSMFVAYAGAFVVQYVSRWRIATLHAVYVPHTARDLVAKIRSGRIGSVDDLVARGMSMDDAAATWAVAMAATVRTDATIPGTDSLTFGDALASDDDTEATALRRESTEWLYGRMLTLTDREREILESVYWRDESLADVARRLGMSRERARQIRDAALARMATPAMRREWEAA